MNVNIFLRQFRVSPAELVDLLRRADGDQIGAERLRGLQKVLPEAEDVERLGAFAGNVDRLGKAERFYLELIALPRWVKYNKVYLFLVAVLSSNATIIRYIFHLNRTA